MEKILKLIISNKVFIIIFSIILSGCYNLSDNISSFFVFDIEESVQFQERINLNGKGLNNDFISIYIYTIKDSNIVTYAKENFQPYFYDLKDTNEILYPLLGNTSGYYLTRIENKELKTLYIDLINRRMLYFVCSL